MHALHGNGLLAPVAPVAIDFAYSWHMTHAAWNALMHALHGNGPSTPLLFALFCCYRAVSLVIAVIHRLWPEPPWSFKTRHNAPRHPWADSPPAPRVLSAQPPAPREPRWRSGRPPEPPQVTFTDHLGRDSAMGCRQRGSGDLEGPLDLLAISRG